MSGEIALPERAPAKHRAGPFEKRIHEVDFARGICMFFVFMDHTIWDIAYFFPIWNRTLTAQGMGPNPFLTELANFGNFYWNSPFRYMVQFVILCLFIFLSGISCAFSKNNWKRAAQMILLWFVLWVGSNLVNSFYNSGSVINWNVIADVAFCVLIYCLFQNLSWKAIVANVGFLLLLYFYVLPWVFYLCGDSATWVPPLWSDYSKISKDFWNPNWDWSTVGNITVSGKLYLNADYMPLFPYIIVFFLGVLFSRFFYKDRVSLFKSKGEWERPICFVGRHSLIFYLGHQALFVAIFGLIGIISGMGI